MQDPSLTVVGGKGGSCFLSLVCFWKAASEAGLCISHAVVKSSSLNLDHALWWGMKPKWVLMLICLANTSL